MEASKTFGHPSIVQKLVPVRFPVLLVLVSDFQKRKHLKKFFNAQIRPNLRLRRHHRPNDTR